MEKQQISNMLGLSVVQATNPVLYILLKYWYLVIIVLCLIGGGGLWQYNSYIKNKLKAVTVEMNVYKDKNTVLEQAMDNLKTDVADALQTIKDFDREMDSIKKSNNEIKNRINGISSSIKPGTKPEEAQIVIDSLRNDISNKWANIGKENE